MKRLLVIGLACLAALPALAGERIGAADLAKTFAGMTMDGVYQNGEAFSETYEASGSIRYRDTRGSDQGKWSVQGEMFCTFYKDQQGACFFVEHETGNCFTFYEPRKAEDGHLEPQLNWSSRGWDHKHPRTCSTAPEVAI